MLTDPGAVLEPVAMDTIGNVEPTMLRMMTVRVVPRASYVAGGASAACDDAKGVVRMEVPCSMTMRDLAAEVLRETSAPTTTMRVRAWLGMNAHRNAEEGVGASAPAVQMYAVDECELVPVPPLTRVEDLASLARDVHAPSGAEVTVYYSQEEQFGNNCLALCCCCCALFACCAACCSMGGGGGGDSSKPPPPRPNTNNTYTPNNYGQGEGGYGNPNQGYNNPGYNNPGYNNPGYNNPGYNNPGYNNPGYNNPGPTGGGYAPNNYGRPPNGPYSSY